MKRYIPVLFVMVLLANCASTPATPPPSFVTTIESEKNSGLVSLEVSTRWKNSSLFYSSGISGFGIMIKNNTDKIVRIVWEKSSLSYNNGSYSPFISGQKYSEATRPMAPTVIPSSGSISKDIYSSDQPVFIPGQYGGWRMNPIVAENILIVLCVESGETEDYYTIKIDQN